MSFHVINSNDRDWTKHRYVLAFGAYGWTVCLVWANHLDDALDECVDWIADNEPGLLCDEAVQEAYNEAIAEGESEEDAMTKAETDMTCAGNHSNYIASWEWTILAEDPDRATLKEIVAQATR